MRNTSSRATATTQTVPAGDAPKSYLSEPPPIPSPVRRDRFIPRQTKDISEYIPKNVNGISQILVEQDSDTQEIVYDNTDKRWKLVRSSDAGRIRSLMPNTTWETL